MIPRDMMKDPRYRGFRVQAYGPPWARTFPFSMCPAAQIRRVEPTRAIAPPSHSESNVGCMSSRKTTPRSVAAGTRTFCATAPQDSIALAGLLGVLLHDGPLPRKRRSEPLLGFRLGAECIVLGVDGLVILGRGALA